jgi:hypothetical protein
MRTAHEASLVCMERDPASKEALVLDLVNQLEVPLLSAAQEEYHEKGWLLCGPTTIVLGNILSRYTGIPLMRSAHWREHFELKSVMYLPEAATGHKANDHTVLAYYTGSDRAYYTGSERVVTIDTVAKLLWGDHPTIHGAFRVSTHNVIARSDDFQRMYGLHAYNEDVAKKYNVSVDGENGATRDDWEDYVHAINSDAVFHNQLIGQSGKVWDVSGYWGDRLVRVMNNTLAALPHLALPSERQYEEAS